MRHLWSLLSGVLAAPVIWVLVALGQDGSGRTVSRWAQIGTYNTANLIEAAVYLLVAGILLGLIGSLRVSPAGPLVAGLLLAAPYAGYFVDPFAVRDAVPTNWRLFGDPVPLLLPLDNGTTFLVGLGLLLAVFSKQRWRQWPAPLTGAAAQPGGVTPDTSPNTAPPDAPAPAGVADETPTIPLPQRTPTSSYPSVTDQDVPAPSLGYPKPVPPPPRRDGESPWSAPPGAGNRDSTFS